MINPSYLHSIKKSIEYNFSNHIPYTKPHKPYSTAFSLSGSPILKAGIGDDGSEYAVLLEDGRTMSSYDCAFIKEPFVNVLFVNGPITRNGGGCSYGSIDLRDLMMTATKNKHCYGHIFYINTPGGSAWAINDFQQAIDFAKKYEQPVLAFIDGDCCSAGAYLASICQERYYMHPEDRFGCIGVMASFYSLANGSINDITKETYHELYDPESFDKNKSFRDISNDGDDKLILEDLAKLGKQFRADVKKHCPNVKEEHLHGKIFSAKEVRGILVNGQSDLEGCIKRCVQIYKQTHKNNNL